jgi:ribosomal protein S18 acetylase RimI-like enzyme
MKVLKADLIHVKKLAEMNKRLIEDERHSNPMNVQQLAQRMSDWLQDEYVGYIGYENDDAVAYCLYRDDGKYYYLRQLFVEREYRRRGIATQFLDWMYPNVWIDKNVRLDVLSHNKEAISFYKAYGFCIGCLRMEK